MSKSIKKCGKEWLHDQYVTQCKTTYEIAIELGCGASTVQRWLHYYEIPIRDCSANKMSNSSQLLCNEDWLRDQYLIQLKSDSFGENLSGSVYFGI